MLLRKLSCQLRVNLRLLPIFLIRRGINVIHNRALSSVANNLQSTHELAILKGLNSTKKYNEVISKYERGEVERNIPNSEQYVHALFHTKKFILPVKTEIPKESVSNSTSPTPPPNFTVIQGPMNIVLEPKRKYLRLFVAFGAVCLLYYFYSHSESESFGSGNSSNYTKSENKSVLGNIFSIQFKPVPDTNTKFSDVIGIEEVKDQLQHVVAYLKNPASFEKAGARFPKGMLLTGPPGTGKTLLARAVAGEAGVPFFAVTGSEFDEVFVGLGARRMRALFAQAKKANPCIIFIDEIDVLATSRKMLLQTHHSGTLNQLLTELDGFEQNNGVFVIAATNLPETLDEAILRPGRFDKTLHVPPPDLKARKEMFDYYLRKVPHDKKIDTLNLAKASVGLTGADISNVVNLAAIKVATSTDRFVTLHHLEEALDDSALGVIRKSAIISPEEKKATAYHESGHALVAFYTKGTHPIHKVTIIPRGSTLGAVAQRPEKDLHSVSFQQLKGKLAVAMGGRAAEELMFGTEGVSTGAYSDFRGATELATDMVMRYGMGNLGKVAHSRQDKILSPDLRNKIDQEVNEILNERYHFAMNLLKEHKSDLELLAAKLIEFETLTGEQVQTLLTTKKLDLPPLK